MKNIIVLFSLLASSIHAAQLPNVVVIFCDDLGYGDLGCFGHPTIKTPNLDRMAEEGQKWTSFYAAACVCTPSRAGLMTGRLPIRNGMCSDKRRVLFPDSKGGLPASEMTIASMLKKKNYRTMHVGKWHLGHLPPYLPTKHGFDAYFGIPYSNDMDRLNKVGPKGRNVFWEPKSEYWNVPLMQNEKILQRSPDQNLLTKTYTEKAVEFIKASRGTPFFLYLAHSMPHVPLFASDAFDGKSLRGLYGDVIEEIDWSVGQVLNTLREEGLADNTLVAFTSDNGPWLVFNTHGGSAGLLRDGKGSTWEGGMREPTVFWWPGKIQPGVVMDMGSTLDLFPTIAALTGIKTPADRIYDGKNIAPALLGKGASPRHEMFYYHGEQLYAVRVGDFKAHFITKTSYVGQKAQPHEPPLLYNLQHDPSEKYDIAKDHPDVIEKIKKVADAHRNSVKPVENQLVKR